MNSIESAPEETKEKEIFVVEGSDVPESVRALRDFVSDILYGDGISDSKIIRYLADDEDVRLKYEEFLESRKDVEKEALASDGKLYVVNKERKFNFRDLLIQKMQEMQNKKTGDILKGDNENQDNSDSNSDADINVA